MQLPAEAAAIVQAQVDEFYFLLKNLKIPLDAVNISLTMCDDGGTKLDGVVALVMESIKMRVSQFIEGRE
jgi:hypothetical protein